MMSPKDIKDDIVGYMNKFVKQKYKFVYGIFYDYNDKCFNPTYLNCCLILENVSDGPIIFIDINYDGTLFAMLDYIDDKLTLSSSNRKIADALADVKETYGEYYDNKYDDVILYFSDIENVKEFGNYVSQIHELLYCTTYIFTLPKTYTFLLSNNKTKIFPKEIAKLIAYKMLFFN